MEKTFVISLGGSLVVPDGIDTNFLLRFRSFVEKKVQEGFRFLVIVGGGKTARRYQDALLGVVNNADNDALDWLGIGALRLNALLVRGTLGDLTYKEVINTGAESVRDIDAPVIVCGANKPGSSTDYGAVLLAHAVGASRVANLSNIDRVYTDDPRKNPDAKPIDDISWGDFRKIIPAEWAPGLSSPFDPVAAKAAEEFGMQVAIMNGENLDNLEKFLQGEHFEGTLIH